MMDGHAAAENERRLANVVRLGRIAEVDAANARVKVESGGITTDWLPWLTMRAGSTRTWSAPSVNEQVVLLSPSGDTGQGVVLPSIYQDDHPAPVASADRVHTVFPDGSSVDYNSASNTLTVTVTGSARVVVNCKEATINAATKLQVTSPESTFSGHVTIQGGLNVSGGGGAAVSGNMTITGGDVKADSISLKGHGHTEQGDGNRTSNSVV